MSAYTDECPGCGGEKRSTAELCWECRYPAAQATPPEGDAWIEAIARGVEEQKQDTGHPFIVAFPWPLGEAQERLVRSLGVTPVYERGSDDELARLLEEAK